MEQHNIDSRFKKGLENLNRQPSADAWARLQSQMNAPEVAPEPVVTQPEEKEEGRVLVWWHYAAAAVVLLFIGIGIIKNGNNFGGKTAPEIAISQPKEMPAAIEKSVEIQKPEIAPVVAPEKTIAQTGTSTKASRTTSENTIGKTVKTVPVKASEEQFKPETENAMAVAKPKKKRAVLVDPAKLPVADKKPVKQVETLLATNTSLAPPKPEIKETKPAGLSGMAIEVIVKRDNPSPVQTLAANTPVQQPEVNQDSKLKSIFKQARKLKEGEKVDLQALGLNSDSKLATSTRSIHQKFNKVLDI